MAPSSPAPHRFTRKVPAPVTPDMSSEVMKLPLLDSRTWTPLLGKRLTTIRCPLAGLKARPRWLLSFERKKRSPGALAQSGTSAAVSTLGSRASVASALLVDPAALVTVQL